MYYKSLLLVFICTIILQTHQWAQPFPANSFIVCGDTKVLVVDYASSKDSIPKIIWEWDALNAKDLPENTTSRYFRTMDDCKAVNNGAQMLISSSGGAIALIDIATKKVLFTALVPNAHSVELLPNGIIAAAASTAPTGNRIMIFDSKIQNQLVAEDTLYSAHGVLWLDKRKSLFALGYDVLREYKITADNVLNKVNEWKIPGIGGHDLQITPDFKKLIVTEHHGCWFFNLTTQKFETLQQVPQYENIKSLGINKKAQWIMTVPEQSWWTYHVQFLNPARSFTFGKMKVYKARWF